MEFPASSSTSGGAPGLLPLWGRPGGGQADWRLLRSTNAPAGRQFALSEALLTIGLAATGKPALRWYVAKQPALILGNGQRPGDADLEAARTAGVRVYRRTSGGTAVLLDEDAINLEVALPTGHPLATGDVVRDYKWIGEVWVRALASLGIEGVRAIPLNEVRGLPPLSKDDPLRLACYGTLSPYEVVRDQRKAVGLSQVRRRGGVLYQMSTYLRWRPERLAALLALSPADRAALTRRLRDVTIGLDELAGRDVAARDVMTAAERALSERLNVRLVAATWTPEELAAADRSQRDRFQPVG